MIDKEKLIEYYNIDKKQLDIDYSGNIAAYLYDNNSDIQIAKLVRERIIRKVNEIYENLTVSFIFNNLSSKDRDKFHDYGIITEYNHLEEVIKLGKIPLGNYYIDRLLYDLEESSCDMLRYEIATILMKEIDKHRVAIEDIIVNYDSFYLSDYFSEMALEILMEKIK